MRCFIAIDLPENIKTYVEEKIELLKNSIEDYDFRPTKKDNLHVTLAFIGEINESELEEVIKKVSEIAKSLIAFTCSLSKIELVPEKTPHMIWVSLNTNRELSELHESLRNAFKLKDEYGGFRAHITAVRIRHMYATKINKTINIKTTTCTHKNEIKLDELKFDVREIKIMQSILKNEGPEYKVIKAVPLKSA